MLPFDCSIGQNAHLSDDKHDDSYCYAVCKFVLIYRQSRPLSVRLAEHQINEHEQLHSKNWNDVKEVVNRALKTLNEIQRSVILLRDYEGYSYDEIGTITGLNADQVKVYIFRGRQQLKNYILKLENVI